MKLFVCIVDDARLLPHFLQHYSALGVDEFHIAAPPSLAEFVDGYSARYSITQYNDLDVAESVVGGAAAVTAMREQAQAPDEYAVIVDLDEFLEPDVPLTRIVSEMEASGATVARGIMFDRFALDGQLKSFDDDSDLPALFPVAARFTKDVMQGFDLKGVIVTGTMKSNVAHHTFRGEKLYEKLLTIAHYKWNDRALQRVENAYRSSSEAGRPWAVEYQRVLDHYERHGRFAWETFGGEVVCERPARPGPTSSAPT